MTTTVPQQPGLTSEEDIAGYLISTPEFFERFAEVLGAIKLANPHGNKAVSLQERQTDILREKIKGLEAAIADIMGHGSENAQIIHKTHEWTRALLQVRDAAALPDVVVQSLRRQFEVPQVLLRLWALDEAFAHHPFAQPVGDAARAYAQALEAPYCGPRGGVEGLQSLAGEGADISAVQSLAILPLRCGPVKRQGATFGYLLLASPDAHRYTADMGTDLLVRLAELAGAALQRLLAQAFLQNAEKQLQSGQDAQQAVAEDAAPLHE